MKEKIRIIKFYDQMDFIIEILKNNNDESCLKDFKHYLNEKSFADLFYCSRYLEQLLKITNSQEMIYLLLFHFNPNTFINFKLIYKFIINNFTNFLFDEIIQILKRIPDEKIEIDDFQELAYKLQDTFMIEKNLELLDVFINLKSLKYNTDFILYLISNKIHLDIIINYTNCKNNVQRMNNLSKIMIENFIETILLDIEENIKIQLTIIMINLVYNSCDMEYRFLFDFLEEKLPKFKNLTLGYVSLLLLLISKKKKYSLAFFTLCMDNSKTIVYLSGMANCITATRMKELLKIINN